MRQLPRPTSDLDLLAALCRILPEGPAICVAPPNSLLDALLQLHEVPACDRLGRIPASLLSHASFAFGQHDLDVLLARQDGSVLVAGHDGVVVTPRGRPMRCERLDHSFDNLRVCSAVEFDLADGFATVVRGARGLILRCRPVLVLHTPPGVSHDMPDVAALLAELGYAFVDADARQLVDRMPCKRSLILALPISAWRDAEHWRVALFGPPAANHAARLATHLAALRRAPFADALEGWQAHIAADLMVTDARLRAYDETGAPVRWTGPRREARIQLFVPAPGAYEIAFDIADSVASEVDGPGQVLGGGVLPHRAEGGLGPRCLIVEATINDDEAQSGCAITLVAPAIGGRMVEGRWTRVGVALSGVGLRRL